MARAIARHVLNVSIAFSNFHADVSEQNACQVSNAPVRTTIKALPAFSLVHQAPQFARQIPLFGELIPNDRKLITNP
jgi:hypothetical protein